MDKEFDDLWPYLESLSDEEIESIHRAAGVELRYRAEALALIGLYLLAVVALFMAFHAVVRAYDLGPSFRLAFVALHFAAVWLGVRGLLSLNRSLFARAVRRVLRGR